jgi:hypothetical protein
MMSAFDFGTTNYFSEEQFSELIKQPSPRLAKSLAIQYKKEMYPYVYRSKKCLTRVREAKSAYLKLYRKRLMQVRR